MGLLATWATGPTNPEDLDEELISPAIRNLLYSLPNNVKEYLNIPLKMSHQNEKLIVDVKQYDLESAKIETVLDNEKIQNQHLRKTSLS